MATNLTIGQKRAFTITSTPAAAIGGLQGLPNQFGILSVSFNPDGVSGFIQGVAAGTTFVAFQAPGFTNVNSETFTVAPPPQLVYTPGAIT